MLQSSYKAAQRNLILWDTDIGTEGHTRYMQTEREAVPEKDNAF